MTDSTPTSAADREIVSSRVFDAPRERLLKAWRDPAQLAAWWGPKGFTNTFHEFDLRPGGVWRFVMHGPDGVDYPNESVFLEVVEPERIVFQHVSGPRFQMTVTFTEEAGGTRLEWRMLFESAAECDKVRAVCVEANEQNFDRLQAQLAKLAP
ncbi:polyketide cyclase [Methylocaldum sp. BRCS4]|uniref:SRPBCC family protein n=1 Tax=Methylocaldum sp. GT1BW TaxID=3438964 RepID=UPI0012EBD40B|nr:polyketide cyclase [Methylocaldum sp. BRCS4]